MSLISNIIILAVKISSRLGTSASYRSVHIPLQSQRYPRTFSVAGQAVIADMLGFNGLSSEIVL